MEVAPSDDALLARARGGDRPALEELIERHQAQIYRFGMKMCRDEEDAKDVLQDTLLAMARGLREFRGQSAISTWLYTIARSFCVKKHRRAKTAPDRIRSLSLAGPEATRVVDDTPSAEEAIAGKQIQHALDGAVAALEPKLREVLILRDGEGLAAAEVAEVLGITVAAVKSRLHRARLDVRRAVAPLLGVPAESGGEGCPDVLAKFSEHVEGDVDAEDCAAMERHLERCDRCRGACESLKRTLALCRATPSVPVPSEVQAAVKQAVRAFLDSAR